MSFFAKKDQESDSALPLEHVCKQEQCDIWIDV